MQLAAAVDTVVGAERSAGTGIEIATQYAGGKVTGVGLDGDTVTICVITNTFEVKLVAEQVHAAVKAVLDAAHDTRVVTVLVADVLLPTES